MSVIFQKILTHWFRRYPEDYSAQISIAPSFILLRKINFILQKPDADESLTNAPMINKDGSLLPREVDSFSWLTSVAPCFPVNGNKVSIIHEPQEFYNTLIEKCETAKFRITLASLYLGTGNLEKKLISTIGQNLNKSLGKLRVKVLLDFTRGSRGEINSRHMLLPLLEKFKHFCQVALYHTPALREPLRSLLPARYNELVGLQHMKIYLFDNSLLISGANLSNDYFTNRQDRYILIEDCPALANFYDSLVQCVSEFSFQLNAKDEVNLHPNWNIHPFKEKKEIFTSAAQQHVWKHLTQAIESNNIRNEEIKEDDTWVFPLVEMGQLGLHHDSYITRQLLEWAETGSNVCLSTGYFNLTNEYIQSIIHKSSASYRILMAHPLANGFFGAKGPAGGIPSAYTELAKRFLKKAESFGQESRIEMSEYKQPGWTFHGKGMWYTPHGDSTPNFILVGSPNFGDRSVNRDLESQLAVLTTNRELKKKFFKEQELLFIQSEPFTLNTCLDPERITPLWVLAVIWLCQTYF